MKTLRRIGILVIVTLAFAFTACDDILEVFYPDFAENPDELNFGIGINVRIELPEEEAAASGVSGKQVEIPLIAGFVEDANSGEPLFPPKMKEPDWWWEDGKNILETRFEFRIKQEGEFRVPIWLEKHGNDYPEWDEPFITAAWERPDGAGEMFWTDIFDFWEGQEPMWIEGFAMIGFERVNYNFRMRSAEAGESSFVIEVVDPDKERAYKIITVDENQYFIQRTWRLFDWSLEGDGDPETDPLLAEDTRNYDGVGSEIFTIDYGPDGINLAGGDFWLEVELFYEDGGFSTQAFPVRIIYQTFDGASYDLHVNIEDTFADPLRLIEIESYPVLVRIFLNDGTFVEEVGVAGVSPNNEGLLTIDVLNLTYKESTPLDVSLEFAWIVLDVAGEGFGDGDFSLWIPLAVGSGEPDLMLNYHSRMMRPLFGDVE